MLQLGLTQPLDLKVPVIELPEARRERPTSTLLVSMIIIAVFIIMIMIPMIVKLRIIILLLCLYLHK